MRWLWAVLIFFNAIEARKDTQFSEIVQDRKLAFLLYFRKIQFYSHVLSIKLKPLIN